MAHCAPESFGRLPHTTRVLSARRRGTHHSKGHTMRTTRTKSIAGIAVLGLASIALAGCSASAEAASYSAATTADTPAQSEPRGVSGTIATVSDSLLQVQDADSQTAVTFTAATTITNQISASLSDIVAGACIMASGSMNDSGNASTSEESSSSVTTVRITEPVDGECVGGFAAMSGGMPGGGGTPPNDGEMPEGGPDGGEMPEMPDGAPADGEMPEMPGGGMGGFVSGKVTAVSGNTITVESVSLAGQGAEGDSAESDSAEGSSAEESGATETTVDEITVDADTDYTKTVSATSEELVAGACVTAMGEYEGEKYAATSLAVSEAGDEGCNTGFGGGFGGEGRGQRTQGANSQGTSEPGSNEQGADE